MKGDIKNPIKRVDSADKTGGYAKYICDMEFEDMLYAKTLRSTKSRARILSIDVPELPKGYYIVDKNDIPNKNLVKMIMFDQPFFADEVVNYIGEPILLVVGPDKEVILDIISKIKVEYEDMDPIFTIEESESSGKKPIFGEDNLLAKYKYSKGDLNEASKRASRVFEDVYRTGYQEHIYLETQGVVGAYRDGKVTVWGSIQCPYYVKDAIKEALGWDSDRIQVIQTTTGGAFGGKEEYPSILGGQIAFAAIKAGKPVQLIFDRDEDIECTTKRHPSKIRLKTYLDESNRIIGMDVDIKLDAGPYAGMSPIVLQRTMFASIGVYNVENVRVKGGAYATNNIVSGAYRGFGAPQAFFALEMHMEHIAKNLGLNTLEFKRANMLKQGDLSSTGGVFRSHIALPEMIEAAENMSGYSSKLGRESTGDKLKGIGMSLFFHGGGFTGNGERDIIKTKVRLKKNADERVEILISNVEMGQGAQTSLRKIVAYTLGMPVENIVYDNPDTDRVPNSGPTVASRTTMIVGKLLERAALKLKEKWDSSAEFEVEENYKHPEGFNWDNDNFVGDAYNEYSWGVNVVEVEVDKVTYEVEVKGVWVVFDIGRAIDERIVEGQIHGGVTQGLGHAGMEVMNIVNGRIMQRTNTDYVIPTSKDFPRIETRLVENPYADGPYGAKTLGELTFVGAPVAYALAVENAIGKPIDQIPVTPEHLMEVMEHEN